MVIFHRFIFVIGLLWISGNIISQTNLLTYTKTEDSIRQYFQIIAKSRNDIEKKRINNSIERLFGDILNESGSFSYPFDSLKNIGHLYSPDKTFRLITWNVSFENGTFSYFGYIQYNTGKTKAYKYKKLIEKTNEIQDPENSVLSSSKWYGGLYYKILQNKVDNRSYYTLLALQFHDQLISRKFIDVLYFDEWENPVFGAPLFHVENDKIKHRVIFQYSASIMMSLRYDEKLQTIVFDHLSPSEYKYIGEYAFYGPDLSFDGLIFRKKFWVLQTKMDMRNPDRPVR